MQLVFTILLFSILLNLILFRLSFGEYGRRRQMQKEAEALSEALRSINRDAPRRERSGLLPWVLLSLLLAAILLLALAANS